MGIMGLGMTSTITISSRYSYGGPVSSLRISDDEIVSDGHCLSISDAIGRRLRDGDKIRYKLKLSERGERH